MAVAVTVTTAVHAQYVTYNHDSPKQNQVTVMETGTGALSPDLYYSVLHNKYKKSAAAKNKLSFRTLAGINLYNQVDEAEAIDSALVKRAKVEALNVADRQADIAWLAEGDKVSRQMDRFRRNIGPYSPVRRYSGRQGTVDGILPRLSVRHQRHERRLYAKRPAKEGVSAHLRGCGTAERDFSELPRQASERNGNKHTAERNGQPYPA